jgi:hypothetical protein
LPENALALPASEMSLPDLLEDLERQLIQRAYDKSGGVKTETARLLGIKTSALYYKLEKYGIGVIESRAVTRCRRADPSRKLPSTTGLSRVGRGGGGSRDRAQTETRVAMRRVMAAAAMSAAMGIALGCANAAAGSGRRAGEGGLCSPGRARQLLRQGVRGQERTASGERYDLEAHDSCAQDAAARDPCPRHTCRRAVGDRGASTIAAVARTAASSTVSEAADPQARHDPRRGGACAAGNP